MWCLQGRDLEVPHPHGAIVVLGVLGCLAGGHLDPVEPAVVPLALRDDGVALLGEVVAANVDAGAIWQSWRACRRIRDVAPTEP